MPLSKSESRVFGEKCLPVLLRTVATSFGFEFRVHPRLMSVSPSPGLHITGDRRADASLAYPLNVFVFLPPPGIRQFLGHVDRPIAVERASELIAGEIRKVMEQAGIDLPTRSQAKSEVLMVQLGDIAL